MPTYVLSNPKVMQQKKSFPDEIEARSASDAAKKLFGSLVERMHNLEKNGRKWAEGCLLEGPQLRTFI